MAAPLIAPIEVPTTRSGRTPDSSSARAIPASHAPSRPPPPSTNAVVIAGVLPLLAPLQPLHPGVGIGEVQIAGARALRCGDAVRPGVGAEEPHVRALAPQR